ncbi:MAG: hypothetical protein FWE89_02315, partial [Syntrophaceae bacterium]|nr:hypothetical protein [Syntrophaceae bacterium]
SPRSLPREKGVKQSQRKTAQEKSGTGKVRAKTAVCLDGASIALWHFEPGSTAYHAFFYFSTSIS